jgi:hypothetical protein
MKKPFIIKIYQGPFEPRSEVSFETLEDFKKWMQDQRGRATSFLDLWELDDLDMKANRHFN